MLCWWGACFLCLRCLSRMGLYIICFHWVMLAKALQWAFAIPVWFSNANFYGNVKWIASLHPMHVYSRLSEAEIRIRSAFEASWWKCVSIEWAWYRLQTSFGFRTWRSLREQNKFWAFRLTIRELAGKRLASMTVWSLISGCRFSQV